MTIHPEMLEQESISTLLDILLFTKPGTESHRDIVKELWDRYMDPDAPSDFDALDAVDEYRDKLFRQACHFHNWFHKEWDRLLKYHSLVGDDWRDPCPKCDPDRFKAERDPPVDDATGMEVLR
jgi:hypothetical protein